MFFFFFPLRKDMSILGVGESRIGPNPCCLFVVVIVLRRTLSSSETQNHNSLNAGPGHAVP